MTTTTVERPSRVAYAAALIGLVVVLDTTIMVIATARLADEFGVGLPVIQWVTTSYTLALVAVIPLSAWLMARFGAYRTYLAAIGVFTLGSLLAACSWNIESLIAFRAVQGLGGGLLMPVGMTIVLQSTPHGARGRTMAVLGLPVLVGPVVGPTLGGWLVDDVSWRAIFLVNVPLGIVGLVNAARTMPRDQPTGDRRLDVVGLLTLSPGVTALVLGLSEAGRLGRVAEVTVIVPAALGVALVGGHVARSVRMQRPLVRFALMRHRSFAAGSGTLAFFVAAYFGSMLVLPLNLQLIRGESAAMTGMFNIPQAIATGVALQVASRLSDRIDPRRIVIVGIALAATGFAGYGAVTAADTPYVQLIGWMVVAGIGVGATLMPTMTSAVRSLDGDDLASGNTVLQIVNQTMVSVGTAVTAVVFATLFAHRVDGADDVDGAYRLSETAREAAAPQMADALQGAMLLPVGLMLCALTVAVCGMRRA